MYCTVNLLMLIIPWKNAYWRDHSGHFTHQNQNFWRSFSRLHHLSLVSALTSWNCNSNILTVEACSPSCWEAGAPLQTFMCRTCLSSLTLALSLSLNRLSASRSLSSSSCNKLCCLCKRASSPIVDPALASRFPPSRQRGRHTAPAPGATVSCGCSSSSKMESCLMTAPCRIWQRIQFHFTKLTHMLKQKCACSVESYIKFYGSAIRFLEDMEKSSAKRAFSSWLDDEPSYRTWKSSTDCSEDGFPSSVGRAITIQGFLCLCVHLIVLVCYCG